METIAGRFSLKLGDGTFPLSTDSMVLGDFVRLPRNARVLDLGSGCGTLGLLLCAKDPGCTVTGLELTQCAHEAALENIRDNHLEHRLYSICADLRHIPPGLAKGSFDLCVSNPPYFSGGAASQKTPLARQEGACDPESLFAAAASMLRYGGDFYLVHKPEKLAQLCFEASRAGLEPKLLRLVRHRTDGPIAMILLKCRKGGKPGLTIDELSLFNPDGTPTEGRRRIYHE